MHKLAQNCLVSSSLPCTLVDWQNPFRESARPELTAILGRLATVRWNPNASHEWVNESRLSVDYNAAHLDLRGQRLHDVVLEGALQACFMYHESFVHESLHIGFASLCESLG